MFGMLGRYSTHILSSVIKLLNMMHLNFILNMDSNTDTCYEMFFFFRCICDLKKSITMCSNCRLFILKKDCLY